MPDGALGETPLGKAAAVPERYDPGVLAPIDRAPARRRLGFGDALPFRGEDVWRLYELSWLLPGGKPCNAVATLRIDCASPATVESKSLKLYANSFAQETLASADAVRGRMAQDIARAVGNEVVVQVQPRPPPGGDLPGFCLDDLPLATAEYEPNFGLLAPLAGCGSDAVHTHLFRSVCPVTGQPDWGSVSVAWRGRLLERRSLLAYLVSYRLAAGFHEDVVERIFVDVQAAAEATALAVRGCFLRRGGIDINPFRAVGSGRAPAMRLWRQ